jgi:hypothetical protein
MFLRRAEVSLLRKNVFLKRGGMFLVKKGIFLTRNIFSFGGERLPS